MKLFVRIFSEKSSISIMRIMAMLSLILGAVLAFHGADASIVGIFVCAAFTGKVAQRYVEATENRHPTAESSQEENPEK